MWSRAQQLLSCTLEGVCNLVGPVSAVPCLSPAAGTGLDMLWELGRGRERRKETTEAENEPYPLPFGGKKIALHP